MPEYGGVVQVRVSVEHFAVAERFLIKCRSEPVSELGRCRVEPVTGRVGAFVVVGGNGCAEDGLRVRGNWGCGGEELCVTESVLRNV